MKQFRVGLVLQVISLISSISPRLDRCSFFKLGVNASNPVELIDAMALRGFKLFDYWKINDFVQTVKEYDVASILTSEGIAVLLRRLGNSSRMTYKLETLTEFPMKISVGVGGETVSRMYLKPDSLETVKGISRLMKSVHQFLVALTVLQSFLFSF